MSDLITSDKELTRKQRRSVLLLSLAALLVLGLCFSASAFSPLMTEAWSLTTDQATWLTFAVQTGLATSACGGCRMPCNWRVDGAASLAADRAIIHPC